MTTNDIRSKFLSFFKSKNHAIITSDSLVPKDDPTVLFTTAGMQQFKPQFLGRIDSFNKAATCQKCLRTDDLDCVGVTDFHHTFFEMLGNFSFGDYFKTQAIHWAWEFLTIEMKLPKEKLWVSVYKDDEEAYLIWLNDIKIPLDRIVKLGDKSNFWPSNARVNGPNGPCGPCSEIFYDYGVNPKCPLGDKCDPDCSCGRFSEVWNLVFTQYNRKDGGVLEPLPAKNIDTGMGLERLAAVVQGVKSNYDTDNFKAILDVINATMAGQGVKLTVSEQRIIADHMRAVVIGIGDGVLPSNEGRGYVMRKLIVDITDLAIRSGAKNAVVHTFVDIVIKVLSQPYPELVAKADEIKIIIKRIEEGFIKVRRERVPELKKRIAELKDKADDLGALFFLYRDTHGLTLTTITNVAKEVGVANDILVQATAIFNAKMEEQKERSRASSKMTGDVFADQQFGLNITKTHFTGYTQMQDEAKVVKIFNDQGEIKSASKGQNVTIILDRTPFYAESGGQVGDTGWLTTPQGQVRVTDTQKKNDIFIHAASVDQGTISVGDAVNAQVDIERRLSIMRNHTATHMLQSALREVLGAHIKQQGSLVDNERLRFDFTHPTGIKPEELDRIETYINEFVLKCDPVTKEVLPIEEAKKKGALAFFAEKYGDTVRIVSMAHYSKEFCGGTHLDMTGQIGLFKIISEGAVAQGIRRIEAVTGFGALKVVKDNDNQLSAIANALKTSPSEVLERVQAQTQRVKQVERDVQMLRMEVVKSSLNDIIAQADDVNGVKVISYSFKDADMALLRQVSDLLKQKVSSAVMVLAAKTAHDASMIISITDDVVGRGVKANELINQVAPLFDGSGGGRPNMAQAGSKNPAKLDEALLKAKEAVKAKL